jgi:hypothetical protein
MSPAPSSEADAFAIAMIVVMFCGLGVIAMIVVTIFRNAGRRNSDVDELIDEVTRKPPLKEKTPAVVAREPWEKDGDWWKK